MLIEVLGSMGKKSEPEGTAPLRLHIPHQNIPFSLIVQSLHKSYNRPRNLWKNCLLHLVRGEFELHVCVAEVISLDLYCVYSALERFSAWEIT